MANIEITDSFNNIHDSILVFNNPEIIDENKELKQIVELLFGKDYKTFLQEQKKSNTQLIIHLSELLNKKTIYETVELLKEEKEKREKLLGDLEEIKKSSTENTYAVMLNNAEIALSEYKYEEYHKILSDYDEIAYQKRNKESAQINFLRAEELRSRFAYKEAISYYKIATERDKDSYVWTTHLAGLYDDKGEYDNSIKYYNIALSVALNTVDKSHPDIGSIYNNLGLAHNHKGENVLALDFFEKSLKIALKTRGKNDMDTATNYNNIGLVYDQNHDYDKALRYHKIALAIDLNTVGDIHQNTARDYNNIGNTYEHKKEYKKAIKYLKIALDINLKTITENHPDTAINYNNLGNAYNHQGDYSTSLKYYKKALEIDLKTIGEEHSNTAIDYNNLGYVFLIQKNYVEAIKYTTLALNIYLKTFGKSHATTIRTLNHLKIIQREQLKVFSNI